MLAVKGAGRQLAQQRVTAGVEGAFKRLPYSRVQALELGALGARDLAVRQVQKEHALATSAAAAAATAAVVLVVVLRGRGGRRQQQAGKQVAHARGRVTGICVRLGHGGGGCRAHGTAGDQLHHQGGVAPHDRLRVLLNPLQESLAVAIRAHRRGGGGGGGGAARARVEQQAPVARVDRRRERPHGRRRRCRARRRSERLRGADEARVHLALVARQIQRRAATRGGPLLAAAAPLRR
eukprot:scaffold1284_cov353-Prasinococcus_capsulatus_cf.AAC.10